MITRRRMLVAISAAVAFPLTCLRKGTQATPWWEPLPVLYPPGEPVVSSLNRVLTAYLNSHGKPATHAFLSSRVYYAYIEECVENPWGPNKLERGWEPMFVGHHLNGDYIMVFVDRFAQTDIRVRRPPPLTEENMARVLGENIRGHARCVADAEARAFTT